MKCASLVLIALATSLTSAQAQTFGHCKEGETDYFSCQIKRTQKFLSICGSSDAVKNPSGNDAWLQYRFGRFNQLVPALKPVHQPDRPKLRFGSPPLRSGGGLSPTLGPFSITTRNVCMKNFHTIITALFFLVPSIGLCQNNAVHEVPFKIAGGKSINLKVTDRGALPAEDAKIQITAAAVIIGPSKENKKVPVVIWSFGLQAKTSDEIEKITVENVFPSDPAALLISDAQPKLKNGAWIGQIENGDPNGAANPWLKSKKLSAFVFKFNVYFKDGSETTLYQLSAFSEADKEFFLKHAEQLRIRNAG